MIIGGNEWINDDHIASVRFYWEVSYTKKVGNTYYSNSYVPSEKKYRRILFGIFRVQDGYEDYDEPGWKRSIYPNLTIVDKSGTYHYVIRDDEEIAIAKKYKVYTEPPRE